MSRLSVCLLGPFEVMLDGAGVNGFESARTRALLAYLAVEADRPHSRDYLATLLWAEQTGESSRANLRQALSNLRQVIKDHDTPHPFLISARTTIQFNLNDDCALDSHVFSAYLTECNRHAHGELRTCPECLERLARAVELYRGDFLQDFSLGDNDDFEQWMRWRREQFHRQALDALHTLAGYHLDQAHYEQARRYARRQLDLEPWREEAHEQLMVALALDGERSAALAQYERCCRVLKAEFGSEPSANISAIYEQLKAGNSLLLAWAARPPLTVITKPRADDADRSVPADEAPAEGDPPFKGLQFFDEADAGLFFGRERLSAQLVERLESSPFVAVVGASGSGKSSLVRAGLIPLLRRGGPSARDQAGTGRDWTVYLLTPTAHPLEALAVSLTRGQDSVASAARLIDDMRADPRSLRLWLRRSSPFASGGGVALVVDQLEELFTLCADEAERSIFIANLMGAVGLSANGSAATGNGSGKSEFAVVLALRADFYAHCAPYPELRESIARRQVYIGGMDPAELRRAIEEPARRAGWSFESGLVDLLLRDVGDEPGRLPLLSHALLETWKRRQGRTLSLKGYSACGGVRGAIAQTAESVYAGLSSEQQALTRRIFLRLTELGAGTQDTRRRVELAELVSGDDAERVRAVLNVLADARLVTISESAVEVTHEALIREWPSLREWLATNRERLRLQHQLSEAGAEWQRAQRDLSFLPYGAHLAQFETLLGDGDVQLSALEQAYLRAGVVHHEQSEADERERLQQVEHERLSKRRLQYAVMLAVPVIVAISLLALFTLQQKQATDAFRQLSFARELAFNALASLNVDPERSLLLSMRSLKEKYTTEGEDALRQALLASYLEKTLSGHTDFVESVAYSPDGRLVATLGWNKDSTVHIWESASGREVQRLDPYRVPITALVYSADGATLFGVNTLGEVFAWPVGSTTFIRIGQHDDAVNSLDLSPDGKLLLTASADGTARLWDVAGALAAAHGVARPPIPLTEHELARFRFDTAPLWRAVFNSDGRQLVTAGADGVLRVWDATLRGETTQPLLTLSGHHGAVYGVACSHDGKWFASAGADQTVRIWDAANGSAVALLSAHAGPVRVVSFNPDGTRLLTAGDDATTLLWDAHARGEVDSALLSLRGNGGPVRSAGFSSDGHMIVTTSADHTTRLWDADSAKQINVLSTPAAELSAVAFSPDGRQVATGSTQAMLATVDVASGRELSHMDAHGQINHLAYSPDGRFLAVASSAGTARIWDSATGSYGPVLRGHRDEVWAVAFSPDGRQVVTGAWDGTARVWDAASGKPLKVLTGHEGWLFSAVFSPGGDQILTSGNDSTARLWDAQSGTLLKVLRGHIGTVLQATFSPDGQRVLTAAEDQTARVWEVGTGLPLLTLRGHKGELLGGVFSPDGKRIATVSQDQTTRIWDAASGEQLLTLLGNGGAVQSVAFSPDGTHVATGGADTSARLWDLNGGRELLVLRGQDAQLGDAALSPDGRRIATAGYDGVVRLWDAQSGQALAVLRGHEARVNGVAFSPDGARLASSSFDKTARLWDARTGQELVVFRADAPLFRLAFDAEGTRLATGHTDGSVHVWDAQSGRELLRVDRPGIVYGVAFSPDGRRLVSAHGPLQPTPGRAYIWDVSSGEVVAELRGHPTAVLSAAFSADGRRIVTGGEDETVRIWDAASGAQLQLLTGHGGGVVSVEFSPDGKQLLTASFDGTARIWDYASGQELIALRGHSGAVLRADYSADGRTIVTASYDHTARLYYAHVADLIQLASTRVTRDLTPDERSRYLHEQ